MPASNAVVSTAEGADWIQGDWSQEKNKVTRGKTQKKLEKKQDQVMPNGFFSKRLVKLQQKFVKLQLVRKSYAENNL